MSPRLRVAAAVLLSLASLAAVATPISSAGKPGPSSSCSKRQPCDTTAPSVGITTPTAGATVSGAVDVRGLASDSVGVRAVTVQVDALSPTTASGTASWSLTLDTSTLADGAHRLTARAADAAGNVGTTTVDLVVANAVAPPPPPPTACADGLDNDADGRIDLHDPGCVDASDADETDPVAPPPAQTPVAVRPTAPGTIAGYVFREADRDGIFENDETPLPDQRLYLYDAGGTYVANATTDAGGWYAFAGLPDGGYRVQLAPASWWALRDAWVPTTTVGLRPVVDVVLAERARADLGWRAIVRSTDEAHPISTYTAPSGLVVRSYDDVVDARSLHDTVTAGALVGPEAARITIRFDFVSSGFTSAVATGTDGLWTDVRAVSDIGYVSALDSDGGLFHEYGHAWSTVYAYLVQQDPSLTAYLRARGLAGDSRVGTSYAWSPQELIAEDYRQLFGDTSARADAQMNREIPAARDVPGLAEFLAATFRGMTAP